MRAQRSTWNIQVEFFIIEDKGGKYPVSLLRGSLF